MKSSRPRIPASYGLRDAHGEDALLPWSWAEHQLQVARNYWLVTVGQDRRPHAMPVWGIWLETSLCFGTDMGSRKAANLSGNRACTVHLESGDEVVILEGLAEKLSDDVMLAQFADRYQGKYGFRPEVDSEATPVFRFVPKKGLGWREKDFPSTATRWKFE